MIGVLYAPQRRSTIIAQAMFQGLRRIGEAAQLVPAEEYRGPDWPVVVFYGLAGRLRTAFDQYAPHPNRTVVYVDLGYWRRKWPTFWEGWHKVSVNARHPTAYFQQQRHPTDRLLQLGIQCRSWRKPDTVSPVLVAGMGDKAAEAEGLEPGVWERRAIKRLRQVTHREIIYRPKPSWKNATPMVGASYYAGDLPLTPMLQRCHALVTHHSNAAVDALVEGVPVFAEAGVAAPMGLADLGEIDRPLRPKHRDQWLADIAYCQWSVAEMRGGAPWLHLKSEGLVP